jgi:hypothetical protein
VGLKWHNAHREIPESSSTASELEGVHAGNMAINDGHFHSLRN